MSEQLKRFKALIVIALIMASGALGWYLREEGPLIYSCITAEGLG